MAKRGEEIPVEEREVMEVFSALFAAETFDRNWTPVAEPKNGEPAFYYGVEGQSGAINAPSVSILITPEGVTFKAVDGIRTAIFSAVEDAIDQVVRWVTPKKTTPVSRSSGVDATDFQIGQDLSRQMKSTCDASIALLPPEVEVVDVVRFKNKKDNLAFNEEIIEIFVHDTGDKTADQFPQVINDGRSQFFIRGRRQRVKRKFVEVLARAKKTDYGQKKYQDGDGNDAIEYPAHTSLLYPFSVTQDPNPRGRDWLERILAEA